MTPLETNSEVVERVAGLIEDDYHRQGALDETDILRVVDKHGLSAEQSIEVRQLIQGKGILVADEAADLAKTADVESLDTYIPEYPADQSASGSSEEKFFRELKRRPFLRHEEVLKLARLIRAGKRAHEALLEHPSDDPLLHEVIDRGEEAKKQLVAGNGRLVLHTASGFSKLHHLDVSDVFQEGILGLIRAAELYNADLGFRFSTYATWWIRQSIWRGIQNTNRLVRIPVHRQEQMAKVRRVQGRLARELHRQPSVEEIAEQMGKSPEEVQFIQELSTGTVSLDTPIGDTGDSTIGDLLPATNFGDPETAAMKRSGAELLAQELSALSPREQQILKLRFGLGNSNPETLEEVGQKFGVTRERIRQIEVKALKRMSKKTILMELADYKPPPLDEDDAQTTDDPE